jgi:hypothetical protein
MEKITLEDVGRWREANTDRKLYLVVESAIGRHVVECRKGEKPGQIAKLYAATVLAAYTGRYDAANAPEMVGA